ADERVDAEIGLALGGACELHMVGPRSEVDARITRDARIRWRGAVPYSELPAIALEADVLIMPYADLPVTRAMQPLKLKEYLATGLPTVVSDLPATRPWSDGLDLAADPESFSAAVRARLATGLPGDQRPAPPPLADQARVGIWHGHDYKSNLLGLLLRSFWPMRLVTTVHGWVQHTRRTPLYYAVDRFSLPHYESVICVSEDLYRRCLAFGVAASRCSVV